MAGAWVTGAWAAGTWAGTAWATDTIALAPDITTTSLPNGTEGVDYTFPVLVTGTGPITWSLDSPVPSGWTIGASTGIVARTSPVSGNFTLRIRATNTEGTDLVVLTLTIADADEFQEAPPASRVWRVTPQRTGYAGPMFKRRMDGLAWGVLAVGDETDVGLDYVDVLEVGETITSSEWVVPVGLTAGAEGVEDSIASQWVTADAVGTYALVNTIDTSGGRQFSRTLYLQVRTNVS
jgi:hypothetical protein